MRRVSALAEKARYAVITEDTLSELFDSPMLHASLYTRVEDEQMAWAATMVLHTLTAIREELQRRIG